jgi:hypothetical protein
MMMALTEDEKHDYHMENASRVYSEKLQKIAERLWHFDIKALIAMAEHMEKHNPRTRSSSPASREETPT